MIKQIIMFFVALAAWVLSKLGVSPDTMFKLSDAFAAGPEGIVSFLRDPTAETSPKLLVGIVVALTVGLVVIGYLFPIGMTAYHSINFSAAGMTAEEQSLYGVLGIFALLCLMLAFIGIAMAAHDN